MDKARWLFDPDDDEADRDRQRLFDEARCMLEQRPYVSYKTGTSLIPEGEEKDPWIRYQIKGYRVRDIAMVFENVIEMLRSLHMQCERSNRLARLAQEEQSNDNHS